MNRTRTFLLMVSLTILFVVVGGAVGGSQGVILAFSPGRWHEFFFLLVQRQNDPSPLPCIRGGPGTWIATVSNRGGIDQEGEFAHAESFCSSRAKPKRFCHRPKPATCSRGRNRRHNAHTG